MNECSVCGYELEHNCPQCCSAIDYAGAAKQPTINTFEELVEKFKAKIYKRFSLSCFDVELDKNNFVSYTDKGLLQIVETDSHSAITFYKNPQQAYNIITELRRAE